MMNNNFSNSFNNNTFKNYEPIQRSEHNTYKTVPDVKVFYKLSVDFVLLTNCCPLILNDRMTLVISSL